MKTFFKTFASFIPGPAIAFVTEWLDLFSHTILALPSWQKMAEDISLGIGVLTALALAGLVGKWRPADLRALAKKLFISTLVLFLACFILWFILGRSFAASAAGLFQDIWFLCFIAAMVLTIATVTILALSLRDKPKIFWTLVIVMALAVISIIAYILWRNL
jgi:cytochrome bd-type quinol oxidase subunit 2